MESGASTTTTTKSVQNAIKVQENDLGEHDKRKLEQEQQQPMNDSEDDGNEYDEDEGEDYKEDHQLGDWDFHDGGGAEMCIHYWFNEIEAERRNRILKDVMVLTS
ncbi:hypothetical protein L6452_30264 [Arctium lappa]|uniref:Uncharacterized protein n=1 Tax=Arctium lappa TaxID=4217 RepID=A0ACB8ZHZ9_ARCLA|nr:hypothetical protein L6452_30264 [Arctium lappa]